MTDKNSAFQTNGVTTQAPKRDAVAEGELQPEEDVRGSVLGTAGADPEQTGNPIHEKCMTRVTGRKNAMNGSQFKARGPATAPRENSNRFPQTYRTCWNNIDSNNTAETGTEEA